MGCSFTLSKERKRINVTQIKDKFDTNSPNHQISKNQTNHIFKSNKSNIKFTQ